MNRLTRIRISKILDPYSVIIFFILLAGCHPAEEKGVLARVGDEVITADEFVLNYEFGHGHLRAGDNPKREYLQFLIYESLMAQEAAKLHLDTLPAIQHPLHTLEEEMLIERVFEEKVLSGIEVTDEEIRAEINRDAVTFRFRLLPAGTEQEALQLREAMLASSFEAVMQEQLKAIPELRLVEGELTSPYVGADELEPEILAIIKDLPMSEPSQPQFYRGAWNLFEVMDIRRKRLAPEDYEQKAPSYHKIIYNRKAMEQGAVFVENTMSPLDVRTKRAGFEVLNTALFEWYSDAIPERNLLHYVDEQYLDTPYTQMLVEAFDTPVVEYRDATWTIHDFLSHFTPGRYVIRPDDPQSFKARLADIVALVVRDAVLLETAEDEHLEDDEAYQRTVMLWKNKWLFQEYRNRLPADKNTMLSHAESLMAKYDVDVNWRMLDTLSTSVSRVNPTMTVHLFKNNANKMPRPIADPNWRSGE